MIMLETIFALLAAIITMFIASLLVRKQNKIQELVKERKQEIKDTLDDIADEVSILTRKEATERSLIYLEKRIETFNKTLSIVQNPTYKRRNKNVKRKKDITDD